MGSARTVVVAALATLVAAPAALAEPGAAVVVVVESLDRAAEPAAIRAALEAEGIPTLSLLDEGAGDADETVTIAIPADGRSARVRLRVGDAVSERVLQRRQGAPADGAWIASPLAALVRAERASRLGAEPEPPRSEVLDPWARPRATEAHAWLRVPTTEVLDPWAQHGPTPRSEARIVRFPESEVLDPWRDRTPEGALSGAVFDPWRDEAAEGLSRPRPRSR